MNMQRYRLAVLGAGAAAPVRPTSGLVPPLFPTKANVLSLLAAEIPTRSGAGIYGLTVASKYQMVSWLDAQVSCFGAAGLFGQVSAYNPLTRALTLRTFVAGTPTDLTATDLVVISISGCDSSTIFP